jgi:hypothetical protein
MPDIYSPNVGLTRNEVILEESRRESETNRLIHLSMSESDPARWSEFVRGVLASLFRHHDTEQSNTRSAAHSQHTNR